MTIKLLEPTLSLSGQEHFNQSAIMMEGQTVLNLARGFRFEGGLTIRMNNPDYSKLSDFTNNSPEKGKTMGRNQAYIDKMNEAFDPKATIQDNYHASMLSNFYKTLFPVKSKIDTNNADKTRIEKPAPLPPSNTPAPKPTNE